MAFLIYLRALFIPLTLEEREAVDLKEAQFELLELHKRKEAIAAAIAGLDARVVRLTKAAQVRAKGLK